MFVSKGVQVYMQMLEGVKGDVVLNWLQFALKGGNQGITRFGSKNK